MLKAISTITNALGALNYKGTWNASSNTPTLADGTGAKGDYYVTSTAGTQTFGGLQLFFGIGDWIVYNGAVWQRVEGGSDGNFANVTMTSTDAGAAAAPLLDLYRDSATPAASDTLGEIEFNGEDSAGNKQQYAVIHASILSPTSTAEAGQIHFETATAGASTEKMIIGTSNLVINDIGAIYNVRIEGDTDANLFYTDATNSRVGIGTISPAFKLSVDGTINSTGILSTSDTTDASSTTAAALKTAGGLAVAKKLYVGAEIYPDQTKGIVGTTTNNSAQAGSFGEYVDSSVTAATVNTSKTNVTTISLTAGDWDVSAVVETTNGGVNTYIACSISQTSADFGPTEGKDFVWGGLNVSAGVGSSFIPRLRVSLSATTTIYLVSQVPTANITTGVAGYISARRMR